MLRAEVRLNTEVQYTGATGNPRLVLTLHADGPVGGFNIEGQIVIAGLDAWHCDQVENELVRRLGGRATLCLGPMELENVLAGTNLSQPLKKLCGIYGWSAADVASRTGLTTKTVEDALAGRRKPYRGTVRAVLYLMQRVTLQPTTGDIIRRYRVGRSLQQTKVAEYCGVSVEVVRLWEDDEAEVPFEKRLLLKRAVGLPPGVWPDEPSVSLALDGPPPDDHNTAA